MLTQDQGEEYATRGLVRLPGAISAADATRMAEAVHEHVATHGVSQFQPLTRAGTFDAVGTGGVAAALDELYPERWRRPTHWGRVLYTPTSDGPWDVPTHGWHMDLPPADDGGPRTITVFVVLAPLRPLGGGTLLLAGSHRFAPRDVLKAKHQRREIERHHPWLRDLWSSTPETVDRRTRFLEDGAVVDGVELRVVEVTGEPGDAFLMRADTFHAVAPNVLDEPRVMLAKGVSLRGEEA